MAVSFLNVSNASVTAGGGDKSVAMSVGPQIGDVALIVVVSQGAQAGSPLGLTDNSPDGLGTYSAVVDVNDSNSGSQMTILIRDVAFGSTTTPTLSTVGIPVGAGAGGWHGDLVRGLTKAGLAAARQSGSTFGPASGSNVVNLPKPSTAGNPMFGAAFQNSLGTISAPSGWSANAASSVTTPPMTVRGVSNVSVATSSSITFGSTPSAAYMLAVVELSFLIDAVYDTIDYRRFPKPLLRRSY